MRSNSLPWQERDYREGSDFRSILAVLLDGGVIAISTLLMAAIIGGLILLFYLFKLGRRENSPRGIDPDRLRKLQAEGRAFLVDVREPDEYAAGHIPGTVSIPLGSLPGRLRELPREKIIVAVCLRGQRSRTAARLLRSAGFAEVYSLERGMLGWPYERERGDR